MGGAAPIPGDVFVRPTPDGAGVFVVGRDRDHPQVTYGSYNEALVHAKRAGARFSVDVWSTKDGAAFASIARYRP
jgi:hypothetical protein